MEPKISSLTEENSILKFTINQIDTSLANALRRIILSEIPTFIFRTHPYSENKATIISNTTRLNNEILKHRLSCIPIHIDDMDFPHQDYIVEIDRKNEGDSVEYVTTGDFKVKNITNEKYLSETVVKKIFPPNKQTGDYIDYARFRPKLSEDIEGEQLSLTCQFDIGTAKENGAFNVASTCSYAATPDPVTINDIWNDKRKELEKEGTNKEDIEFEKKNWLLLEAQRHTIKNSFDFIIESVGVFDNITLVKKATIIMVDKCEKLLSDIESGTLPIKKADTTINNCLDITLVNEDYTLGKVIEYYLYTKHYEGDSTLSFCGFSKPHPHDKNSFIRIAFNEETEKSVALSYIAAAANDTIAVFNKINDLIQIED
jgi:DNA-directed RNA polymerase subunit L